MKAAVVFWKAFWIQCLEKIFKKCIYISSFDFRYLPRPDSCLYALINLVVSLWLVDCADKMGCYSEPGRSLFHNITPLFAGCLHPERTDPGSAGRQEVGNISRAKAYLCTTIWHPSLFLQSNQLSSLETFCILKLQHKSVHYEKCWELCHFPKHSCENTDSKTEQTDFTEKRRNFWDYLTSCKYFWSVFMVSV